MKYDAVVVLEHCKAPPRIEIRVANSTEAFWNVNDNTLSHNLKSISKKYNANLPNSLQQIWET
jgi:hypothetical protein